jgi:trigger factor
MTTEYKSDHVTVLVTKDPGCKTTFDINVTPKGSEAAWLNAVKRVKKEVSLPGFRKGKAPDGIILQNFKKYVESEWKEVLVETAFHEAVRLSSTFPIDSKRIQKPELKKSSIEEGSHVIIRFEARPQVPTVDYQTLKLSPITPEEITNEKVEDGLQKTRIYYAEWEDALQRPVQEGDYVHLDIENLNKPGMKIAENQLYHIKQETTADWLRNIVIGKTVGESAEGQTEGENVIPVSCKVTINAIREPKLPEVNEEFIKKCGGSSLEDLKEKIKRDLERQEERRIQDEYRNQIEKELLEKYPFDIPLSFVEYEHRSRMAKIESDYQQMGLSPEKIKELLNNKREKILADVVDSYRIFFLTRMISQKEKIEVSDHELMRASFEHFIQQGRMDEESMEETRELIQAQLLEKKTLDFIISKLI